MVVNSVALLGRVLGGSVGGSASWVDDIVSGLRYRLINSIRRELCCFVGPFQVLSSGSIDRGWLSFDKFWT